MESSYKVSTPQEEGSWYSAPVPPETPEHSSEVFSSKNKKGIFTKIKELFKRFLF
ncbi:MAG: hypothetical protein U0457_16570 [Candidatus Sericytochromatia bacterium]